MFHTIYQITNNINSKIYIGKHSTVDLDDGYMGSGKLIRAAIRKYGVENFQKEILYVFDEEADMNAKEAELVTAEFVLLETNYNLCVGGNGGFSYINRAGLRNSPNQRQKAAETGRLYRDHPNLKASGTRSANLWHERGLVKHDNFAGKTHTYESKQMISEKAKISSSGSNNSQYGTMWITNGSQSKKILKTDVIPEGWRKGRKIKWAG